MGHRNEEVLAGIIVASGLRERTPSRAASLKPA